MSMACKRLVYCCRFSLAPYDAPCPYAFTVQARFAVRGLEAWVRHEACAAYATQDKITVAFVRDLSLITWRTDVVGASREEMLR